MNNFDYNQLKASFLYDAKTGVLTRTRTQKPAKSLDVYGYIQVGYLGKIYKAHRLIWAIVYGTFPEGVIDHINGNRSDNRLDNLRIVTRQQNSHNQKNPHKTNKSKHLGVCWNKRSSKWQAGISVNNKTIYLGVFETVEQAHNAYVEAKKIYHPSAPAR